MSPYKMCDGRRDCRNREDEAGCYNWTAADLTDHTFGHVAPPVFARELCSRNPHTGGTTTTRAHFKRLALLSGAKWCFNFYCT